MKNKILVGVLTLLLTFTFSGCSNGIFGTNSGSGEIQIDLTESSLLVKNEFPEPVYYFVVESGTAAAILWAPTSSEENRINPGQQKEIKFTDIYGYEDEARILFYYWTGENPDQESIMNKSIETN